MPRTVVTVTLTDMVDVVQLPIDSTVVHVTVGASGRWPVLHVEVDPAQPAVDVMYLTIAPGDPIAPGAQHVGSVPDGEHGVVHVFEVPLG